MFSLTMEIERSPLPLIRILPLPLITPLRVREYVDEEAFPVRPKVRALASLPVSIGPVMVSAFAPRMFRVPPPVVPDRVIPLSETSVTAETPSPHFKLPDVVVLPKKRVAFVPKGLLAPVLPIVFEIISPSLIFRLPLKLLAPLRVTEPLLVFDKDPVPLIALLIVFVPVLVLLLLRLRLLFSTNGFAMLAVVPVPLAKVILGVVALGVVAELVTKVSAAPSRANVLEPVVLMLSAFNVYGAALVAVRLPVNAPRNFAVDFSSLTGAMSHAVAPTVVQSVVPTTLLLV